MRGLRWLGAALFWVAIVSAAIQYSLTFTGLKGLDAGVTALIVQLEVPFLTLLGALLLKEVTGLRKWLGIGVAFVGVAIIVGTPAVAVAWGSVALVIGGVLGYVARGGPDPPAEIQVTTPVPVVTVTVRQ